MTPARERGRVTTTRSPLPGDFFVTVIPGWKGWLVRLLQWSAGRGWSQWQHAGLYIGNHEIIEAAPGGTRIVPLATYDGMQIAWSSWPLDPGTRASICSMGRDLDGTPYAWLGYLLLALHRLHIPAPGLERYISSARSMICSQLVDFAYECAGVHLFRDDRWPGDVTPADLGTVLEGPQ